MAQTPDQIGMSSLESGAILIADKTRLIAPENLAIDCVGSERAPSGGGGFSRASYWLFCDGELWFGSGGVQVRRPEFGAGCLFLPGVK